MSDRDQRRESAVSAHPASQWKPDPARLSQRMQAEADAVAAAAAAAADENDQTGERVRTTRIRHEASSIRTTA